MNFFIQTGVMIVMVLGLMSCDRESEHSKENIITVRTQTPTHTLFYSGVIQPLAARVVPSPAEGVILEMPFQYGEEVKAGQLLFILSSGKFLTDYKAALLQYVKAKSDFNNSQTLLTEGEFLHKNQLISDDEFKTKKSNYYANQLALLQAKDVLESLLRQLNVKNFNLYNLSISDIDKITQALQLQKNSEVLRIVAPENGILLSPAKNEEENKKISKGDLVKQGDVLALLGDMSGLSVRIKVNELTINRLRIGDKVKVTGIAFPDQILEGTIKRIERQGESSGGGLPTFNVELRVAALTKAQQKQIHVGMSAKVEIALAEPEQIMVPMTALSDKGGIPHVRVYDEKTKTSHELAVNTGKTTLDSVAIIAGLNVGDKIVLPN